MKITDIRLFPRISKRLMVLFGGAASLSAAIAAPSPAKYVKSASSLVAEGSIDQNGGVLAVPKTGAAVDGIRVVFPAGAVDKRATIKLIGESGTLTLKSGEGSNAFLRIDAGTRTDFSRPIEIEVTFDRERVGKRMIQGYAIDEEGRLAAVSMKSMDRATGKVVFSTMVPLLFTWVITSK